MSTGTTVQIIGAVVDVEFPADAIPNVYDALLIEEEDLTLEVQQQLGDGIVRTIAMGSSEGLKRGLTVTNTGKPISVPVDEQLLPLIPAEEEELKHYWDYIYEPDARDVLEHVFVRYIESLVYQAVVENIACEQAARMVAMKSASDNAGKLIDELNLAYNKARQAAITQEISEIVGGAAAV